MSAFVIARLTFREASRRWILWMALLLGVLFLAVYAIGFNEIHKDIQRRAGEVALLERGTFYNFMLMAGLYVVNFLTAIMAVLTSVDTLSGEIRLWHHPYPGQQAAATPGDRAWKMAGVRCHAATLPGFDGWGRSGERLLAGGLHAV